MKILYDCAGGDHAPNAVIEGAYLAREQFQITPYFVGDPAVIKNLVREEDKSYIIPATEVITNEEEPSMGIRRKKDSTVVVGLKALNTDEYDAFISAGSTGALLAGGILITKRIEGVERAALPVFLPSNTGVRILLDAGANTDTSPELLVSFAEIASVYLSSVYGIDRPLVGLLNIGAEKGKGDLRSKETYEILEKSSLNFYGNVEAREILTHTANIILTDGFAGNVALKTMEGVLSFVKNSLKEAIYESGIKGKIGGALLSSSLKEKMSFEDQGGAPLLGVRRPVIKAHGSSEAHDILHATAMAIDMVEKNVIEKIELSLKNQGSLV